VWPLVVVVTIHAAKLSMKRFFYKTNAIQGGYNVLPVENFVTDRLHWYSQSNLKSSSRLLGGQLLSGTRDGHVYFTEVGPA